MLVEVVEEAYLGKYGSPDVVNSVFKPRCHINDHVSCQKRPIACAESTAKHRDEELVNLLGPLVRLTLILVSPQGWIASVHMEHDHPYEAHEDKDGNDHKCDEFDFFPSRFELRLAATIGFRQERCHKEGHQGCR